MDGRNPPLAQLFEAMVETITFVGICRGTESFQGFLGGAKPLRLLRHLRWGTESFQGF